MSKQQFNYRIIATAATLGAALLATLSSEVCATPPAWNLVWEDTFDTFDGQKWTKIHSTQPTNHSQQAYLPQQVTIDDGKLVITATDTPFQNLPYRSGQIISKSEQRFGRWEIRASLPTTQGMWPAIWLLPDVSRHNWPSGGEIDIMENRGNQPLLTSSAFHYGTNPPYHHDFVYQEHQAANLGGQINYHEGFHTYAVDWTDRQIRFYVDDVHHYTVYDEDVGNFISQSTAPMQLVINNAIGGTFLPNPDASPQWPQKMEIDWVKVYEQGPGADVVTFSNGSFEENGGSLAGWSVFGSTLADNSNVSVRNTAVEQGEASLKLFGQFGSSPNYSGVTQGISVLAGQTVQASLEAFISSADSLTGTGNLASLKIEFYDHFGAKFGSGAMLDVQEIVIANASTTNDAWHSHTLTATAPENAVEARLAVVFTQGGTDGGAVFVDSLSFQIPTTASTGDFNADGMVDATDYAIWRNALGQTGPGLAADADGNGVIDTGDYTIWQSQFGATLPTAAAVEVPEPLSCVLLLLYLPALLLNFR